MLFIHVKTLRKISEFPDFDRSNVSLDWSKKLKNSNLTAWLVQSILDCLSIDRSKFDRSTSNQKSIYLKKSNHCFTWSIKSDFRPIETRETWISKNFLRQFSTVFLEQTTNIRTWKSENDIKTEIYWCYSLKDQFNLLKCKFKQHHNINISFYQIIVSTTCRKLKT